MIVNRKELNIVIKKQVIERSARNIRRDENDRIMICNGSRAFRIVRLGAKKQ